MPFVRPFDFDLHAIGLWWRKPSGLLESETTPTLVRMALAVVACVIIVPLGCMLDHESWFWGDTFLVSLAHAGWATVAAGFLLSALPHSTGIKSALISRILSVVPVLFLMIQSSMMPPQLEFDEYYEVAFGLVTTFLIVDVRCLLSFDRYPRVSLLKTLVIGSLATAATAMIEWDDDHHLFAGAIAMSTAIVLQLIAPHGRTPSVQSQQPAIGETDFSVASSHAVTEPIVEQEV